MPLCSKCHQNEGTIHPPIIVNGVPHEALPVCQDCLMRYGYAGLNLQDRKPVSLLGKTCEFCGRDAKTAGMRSGDWVYWCRECSREHYALFVEVLTSERPDLLQMLAESTSSSLRFGPGIDAWFDAARQRVVRTLRDRKKQDRRDKGA